MLVSPRMRTLVATLLASMSGGCVLPTMPLERCDATWDPHPDCAIIARREPDLTAANDDGVVRFFAVGDAGKAFSRDGTQLAATTAFVASLTRSVCHARGGCDFGVFLGDNVYEEGIETDEERAFFENFAERYSGGWETPLVFILGNHDYDPIVPSQARARAELTLIDQLAQKHPGKIFGRSHFFTMRAGPVELFGWDTNHLVHACDVALGETPECVAEGDSALREIRESSAPFKIWLGHHPYWSNGQHGNAGDFEDGYFSLWRAGGFAQLVQEHVLGQVDLMLAGHDHNLQAFSDAYLQGTAIVVSGAGAKSTPLGRIDRHGEALYAEDQVLGLTLIEATSERITVEIFAGDLDGALVPHPPLAGVAPKPRFKMHRARGGGAWTVDRSTAVPEPD